MIRVFLLFRFDVCRVSRPDRTALCKVVELVEKRVLVPAGEVRVVQNRLLPLQGEREIERERMCVCERES